MILRTDGRPLEIAALQQLADGTRETLREDGKFVLYRDRRRSNPPWGSPDDQSLCSPR